MPVEESAERRGPVLSLGTAVVEIPLGVDGASGRIKPMVTGEDHGSSVTMGTFVLEPGQVSRFELPHPSGMREEIYYIITGELEVADGEAHIVAGPGDAVFFPPGGSYEVRAHGNLATSIVWSGYPPSR